MIRRVIIQSRNYSSSCSLIQSGRRNVPNTAMQSGVALLTNYRTGNDGPLNNSRIRGRTRMMTDGAILTTSSSHSIESIAPASSEISPKPKSLFEEIEMEIMDEINSAAASSKSKSKPSPPSSSSPSSYKGKRPKQPKLKQEFMEEVDGDFLQHQVSLKHHQENLIQPSIQVQTQANAKILFDSLAPHTDVKSITNISKELSKLTKQWCATSSSGKDHASSITELKGNIYSIINQEKNVGLWVYHLVHNFLLGLEQPGTRSSRKRLLEEDDSYTPNQNRKQLQQDIISLMKARDRSVGSPLTWGTFKTKKSKKKKKTGTAESDPTDQSPPQSHPVRPVVSTRPPRFRSFHLKMSEESLREEAEDMANLLADRLPPLAYKRLLSMFSSYGEPCGMTDHADTNKDNPPPKRKDFIRNLFPCVKQKVGTHVHLVIFDLASFLYADGVPIGTHTNCADARVVKAWKEWNSSRDNIAGKLLESQQMFAQHFKENFILGEEKEEDENCQEIQKDVLTDGNSTRTQDIWNSLQEVPHESTSLLTIPKKKPRRMKEKVHLVFDALLKTDNLLSGSPFNKNDQDRLTEKSHRSIFIDNLPIDITPRELHDAYSRLGEIHEPIQILNARPDLDPGPLHGKDLLEFRKNQKFTMRRRGRMLVSSLRTPVYAKVQFSSEVGYLAAMDAHLRIFGMVLRKHCIRSKCAEDKRTLYLENLPGGVYSLDVEGLLKKLLGGEGGGDDTDGLYVCLDGYTFMRKKKGEKPGLSDLGHHEEVCSCEIKFPSYEMAENAFDKLQTGFSLFSKELKDEESSPEGDNFDGLVVNWVRTPTDAADFWTRKKASYDV